MTVRLPFTPTADNLASLIAVDFKNKSGKLSVQIQLHKTFHPSLERDHRTIWNGAASGNSVKVGRTL